ENLNNIINDIKIIEGDILDYEKLKKSMKGHQYVSHQAAQLEILRCIEDPLIDLRINTIGTLNVLKACVENRISKVINASSACVYGQAQYIPQDENHPTNPNWPYGVSKLATEKYANIYHESYGVSIINLRYSIVYGEREWLGRVLTMFLKRILEDKPLVIFGKGDQLRDFIYVKDLVKFHNLCFGSNKNLGNNVYNVSTGIGVSIKELANIVIEVSGKSTEIVFENVKEGEFSRYMPNRKRIPAELKRMVLDNERAKRDFNWYPATNLKEGIERELSWIAENPSYWRQTDIIHV
ncbi:MAG: hypothetical protein DRP72_01135, partial [Candidatus Omnitrophota bacterium]